jgi:hypothetical protein
MSKRSRHARTAAPAATPAPADRWPLLAPGILFGVALICYWVQLTSAKVSILWDAADFFLPIQNYLSQELHAGRIPFWSPYPSAGFPFLADPQVGAWYPPNWPFFLGGLTQHLLFAENWLHVLIACFGAYLLAFRLIGNRAAAVLAGLCYGLSGFFTGHSSHTVMVQTAAWLPWLLLTFDRASESRALRECAYGCLVSAVLILAGHFQSALYCFFALALFALARMIEAPWRWPRIALTALALPVVGTLISAVAVVPGLELAAHSIRTIQHAVFDNYGFIPPAALVTLFLPDFYGATSDNYHGPADITQYYFYAGILLLPLAIWGATNRRVRLVCGLVFAVPLWYALGPSAGLFLLIARLPGFASVRAPVNIWFVPALALAILAAAGLEQASRRWRKPWIAPVLIAVFAADLFYFNFANNQLAYARVPYEQLYGQGENLFQRAVASRLPPLMRFDSTQNNQAFGPFAHYYDLRTEVTYGYDPLTLTTYHEYSDAMQNNPKLRNGLGVALWLDLVASGVRNNPDALPRVTFPPQLIAAASPAESRRLLATLDPARQAIVPSNVPTIPPDPSASARIIEYTSGHYKIHYRAAAPSIMRVSNAYFDGWSAAANGNSLAVFPIDHALIGVRIPSGEGDLTLDYHSTYLVPGLVISALSLAACVAILLVRGRANIK